MSRSRPRDSGERAVLQMLEMIEVPDHVTIDELYEAWLEADGWDCFPDGTER